MYQRLVSHLQAMCLGKIVIENCKYLIFFLLFSISEIRLYALDFEARYLDLLFVIDQSALKGEGTMKFL